MKFRTAAVASCLVLTLVLIFFSGNFFSEVEHSVVTIGPKLWLYVTIAIGLQLVGHVLRTLRTKTVMDEVKKSSFHEQFAALAAGYLFNTLLPLRLGEMVRSVIIALRLRVSLLYTFTVILLERIIDLIFIGCLVILASFFYSGHVATLVFIGALGAVIVAAVALTTLVLLVQENPYLLTIVWKITGWLNSSLCNKMRFKVWSLIFGLQQFLHRKDAIKKYLLFALLSWVCYIGAMAAIALPLLPQLRPTPTFVVSTSPYIASTSSLGPDFMAYTRILRPIVSKSTQNHVYLNDYVAISWLILTAPMFLLGFTAITTLKVTVNGRNKAVTNQAFINKLLRQEDVSQEFPAFLDTYFRGYDLSRILHRLELSGQFSLVKFFKGGSDAITVLVLSDDTLTVKKVIPLIYKDRLKAQYDWLQKHRTMPFLVKALGEQTTDSFYAIDLAYSSENIPFFEYAHYSSLADAQRIIAEVWDSLFCTLHAKTKKAKSYPERRDNYIAKHIIGCLDKAVTENDELRRAMAAETLVINGKVYDNLHRALKKIKEHPQAWADLATYKHTGVVHGDPSIDNILVSDRTGKPLIIDPAPDGNIIEGPVFDMGKMMQSFYCGYEFLFRDEDPVHLQNDNAINYRDHRSERYMELRDYVLQKLAPQYLNDAERRALLFHAAALLFRRMKHQVHFCPANSLKFYAVGVKTLNEFLEQYK